MSETYNVLFLCTGNSARSIIAESVMNHLPGLRTRFRAFSAGSHPKAEIHPLTLTVLEQSGFPVDGLSSKRWDEYAGPGAPRMDFVFTVCDQAANEICPVWPGQPMTAHWGVPDPAAAAGSAEEKLQAFRNTLMVMRRRIELFAALPLSKLERLTIRKRIEEIGSK